MTIHTASYVIYRTFAHHPWLVGIGITHHADREPDTITVYVTCELPVDLVEKIVECAGGWKVDVVVSGKVCVE